MVAVFAIAFWRPDRSASAGTDASLGAASDMGAVVPFVGLWVQHPRPGLAIMSWAGGPASGWGCGGLSPFRSRDLRGDAAGFRRVSACISPAAGPTRCGRSSPWRCALRSGGRLSSSHGRPGLGVIAAATSRGQAAGHSAAAGTVTAVAAISCSAAASGSGAAEGRPRNRGPSQGTRRPRGSLRGHGLAPAASKPKPGAARKPTAANQRQRAPAFSARQAERAPGMEPPGDAIDGVDGQPQSPPSAPHAGPRPDPRARPSAPRPSASAPAPASAEAPASIRGSARSASRPMKGLSTRSMKAAPVPNIRKAVTIGLSPRDVTGQRDQHQPGARFRRPGAVGRARRPRSGRGRGWSLAR